MPVHEKSRVRSPSFPFISLREAVDRARAFYLKEKQHAAPPQVAVTYWGYSSLKSSGGPRTIAALRAYGLLEEEEDVRLTERALALLRDEIPAAERRRILQEMALLPSAHRILWDTYGAELPSDANLNVFLVEKLGFNPESVEKFLRNYREVMRFAGLAVSAAPGMEALPPPSSAPEHSASSDFTPRFPLMDGSELEVRAPRKVTRREAEQLRLFFELWLKTITAP